MTSRMIKDQELNKYEDRVYMGGIFEGYALIHSSAEKIGERADSYQKLYKLYVFEGTLIFYSENDEGIPDFKNVKQPQVDYLYFIDKHEEISKLIDKRAYSEAYCLGDKVVRGYIKKAHQGS